MSCVTYGAPHGTRYVRHGRGRYSYPVRSVRGANPNPDPDPNPNPDPSPGPTPNLNPSRNPNPKPNQARLAPTLATRLAVFLDHLLGIEDETTALAASRPGWSWG